MKHFVPFIAACVLLHAAQPVRAAAANISTTQVHLITLDPGHFHAALVQKFMYSEVDPTVHVYAPPGDDVTQHLKRINTFNTRANLPTHWHENVYTGADYLGRMLSEHAGNVVVLSGNNSRKTEYIVRAVAAGMHVLADKPMVISPEDFVRLQAAFADAQKKGLVIADMMTERYEISTILQRELSRQPALFGTLETGSAENPAITQESVHHFAKTVAGTPMRRPQWFFDVKQEGEGILDIATHLVDLVQWEAFPEQSLQPSDVDVIRARHWATTVTRKQFERLTGASDFPEFLRDGVRGGRLYVLCDGELTYRLRGVYARVSVNWNYEAPPGGGDTLYSIMRGTRANLIIRQGAVEKFRPVLYVEPVPNVSAAQLEKALHAAIANLQSRYPGVGVRREGDAWVVVVPERYDVGHEAHFAQVTENFIAGVRSGHLAAWEVPNMLTKYSTLVKAYQMTHVIEVSRTAGHTQYDMPAIARLDEPSRAAVLTLR